MQIEKIFKSILLIGFIFIGCTKRNQVIIKPNFTALRFKKVPSENFFSIEDSITKNPYIDTIINITVINEKNNLIKLELDSTNVSLNWELYGKKIKVRENRFVLRLYDGKFKELYFNSGFLNPDSSVINLLPLQYVDSSKSHIINSKEVLVFRQKIRLPIINMYNFTILDEEDFSQIAYGRLCLFNGYLSDLNGIDGVYCSEPFLITH